MDNDYLTPIAGEQPASVEDHPTHKEHGSAEDRSVYQNVNIAATEDKHVYANQDSKPAGMGNESISQHLQDKLEPTYDASTEKPNDNKELAALACVCNIFFGLIAVSFALKSLDAYRRGNIKAARRHGVMALGFSVLAFAVIFAVVLTVVILRMK